jgi:hypothetical protein
MTVRTLPHPGWFGCARTQAMLASTSTPPMDARIRRSVGFSAWGRITIEIAQGEPQHDVGTERNQKDGVRDLPHSLNPYPQLTLCLRRDEVGEAPREVNVDDGVENNPDGTREERGPEEDSEDRATTNSILEALVVLVLELFLELELKLVNLVLVVHHQGIDRQPEALDEGLARPRNGA